MRLIDNAKEEFHRLWTIRLSLGIAVFTATGTILASANGTLSPEALLWLNVAVNGVVLPALRLIKQDDKGDDEQG